MDPWFDQQVNVFKDHLETVFKPSAKMFESILKAACPRLAPAALVQARAKAVPSFAKKILAKRHKYKHPARQLTDLVGARVIVQTLGEVEQIANFIRTHFEIDEANSLDTSERLGTDKFGYLSLHLVVQFKPGVFPNPVIPITVPALLYPHPDDLVSKKAEIQVRTIAQHVWADIGHDRLYKSAFRIPDAWQREAARVAAMVENVDQILSRLCEQVDDYRSHYDAFLSAAQMRDERGLLETVLSCDPSNQDLARQIVRLSHCLEDWQAIDRFFQNRDLAPWAKASLGTALCRLHRANPQAPAFQRGQRLLEESLEFDPCNHEAVLELSETWTADHDGKALKLSERAFEHDPTNPSALGLYLVQRVAHDRSLDAVALVRPALDAAVKRCTHQADAKLNLPWALYWKSVFKIFLEKPIEGLHHALQAMEITDGPRVLDFFIKLTQRLSPIWPNLPAADWLCRLLQLGRIARFAPADGKPPVAPLATDNAQPFRAPVVILAGGCDAAYQQQMQAYRQLLIEAFRDFQGTVLSGGTTAGISGLAGDLAERYPGRITLVGYVPQALPPGAVIDQRYHEIRRTPGADFSPLEPLQDWIDILASGLRPQDVVLLGINGGVIAEWEYRLAKTLGARVGILRDSGRAAGKFDREADPGAAAGIALLPQDPATLREFLRGPAGVFPAREIIAKARHDEYRESQRRRFSSSDPAMEDWDKLLPDFKSSSLQQADHMLIKLAAVGLCAVPVTDRPIKVHEFSDADVERLAEMEHARWNVERLLAGWSFATVRDPQKKLSPYLDSWQNLSDEVREWDRHAVRAIPKLLASIQLEVQRA